MQASWQKITEILSFRGRKSWLNLLIKVLIIVAAYWALYVQIFKRHRLSELLNTWDDATLSHSSILIAGTVVVLMIANWFIEAIKWKLLIRKIRNIGLFRALRGVLAGLTVSLFTPNRTGEFFGRILVLDDDERGRGIFATIIGSMSQLLITLLVGIPAFFVFLGKDPAFPYEWNQPAIELILFCLSILAAFLLLLFLNLGFITRLGERLIREEWVRLRSYLHIFGQYKRTELLSVLSLSLLRYLVFGTQFFLMLRLFGLNAGVGEALILIPSIYLAMSVFPSLTLAELGLRGTVTVIITNLLFDAGGAYDMVALAASGSIWLLNLVLPALAGTAVIAGIRIFNSSGD
jgi:hypothetical protein